MNDTLAQQLEYLRLTSLLSRWDEHLKSAAQSNLSHARFLTHVIEEEYRLKCEQALQQRLKLAKIPEKLVMDTFPFDRQPKLSKEKILALYDSMAFLREKQNIIWLGSTGCGKTGLATSFLIQAMQQGARGRYILFTDLLNELHRSQADRSQNQVIRRYVKYDLLLIDEIGYAEAEPSQVGLFFTLPQKRHKQRSTLITSNLGFSEWASFLKNTHLTAALIDRLTESSHVFNMRECVTCAPRWPLSRELARPSQALTRPAVACGPGGFGGDSRSSPPGQVAHGAGRPLGKRAQVHQLELGHGGRRRR